MLPIAQLLKNNAEPLYIGSVVANNASGQVQVTIPEVMAGDTSVLPWLNVVTTPGGQSKTVLPIGSQVIVSFPFGDFNHGLIMGTLQTTASLPAGIDTEHKYGFADDIGNTIILDKDSGTINVASSTGVNISVSSEGGITINAPKEVSLNVTDDFTINCKNFNLNASANIALSAGGSATYSATSQMNIESQAQVGFTAGTGIAGSAPTYAWT